MPVLTWEDNELPVVKPGFKYYWIIVIPLTFFVVVSWFLAIVLPWENWRKILWEKWIKKYIKEVWPKAKKERKTDVEETVLSPAQSKLKLDPNT